MAEVWKVIDTKNKAKADFLLLVSKQHKANKKKEMDKNWRMKFSDDKKNNPKKTKIIIENDLSIEKTLINLKKE